MKLREPIELDFPMEAPGVLNRMLMLHLETFGYSIPDFAQILHWHAHRVKQLYQLNDHYQHHGGALKLA